MSARTRGLLFACVTDSERTQVAKATLHASADATWKRLCTAVAESDPTRAKACAVSDGNQRAIRSGRSWG